jgi:hypothetical protein
MPSLRRGPMSWPAPMAKSIQLMTSNPVKRASPIHRRHRGCPTCKYPRTHICPGIILSPSSWYTHKHMACKKKKKNQENIDQKKKKDEESEASWLGDSVSSSTPLAMVGVRMTRLARLLTHLSTELADDSLCTESAYVAYSPSEEDIRFDRELLSSR